MLFHGKRHPRKLGVEEIRDFLSDLAVHRRGSASTKNQAFSALLFLYPGVLRLPLLQIERVERETPYHHT